MSDRGDVKRQRTDGGTRSTGTRAANPENTVININEQAGEITSVPSSPQVVDLEDSSIINTSQEIRIMRPAGNGQVGSHVIVDLDEEDNAIDNNNDNNETANREEIDDDFKEYYVISDEEEEEEDDDELVNELNEVIEGDHDSSKIDRNCDKLQSDEKSNNSEEKTVEQVLAEGNKSTPTNLSNAHCAVCFDSPERTFILVCGHVYCGDCVFKALTSTKSSTKTRGPCSLCRKQTSYKNIIPAIFKRKVKK